MSKSMAIDAIMKIFLMIAVIVVGVSFLLRAFSIDIFGNLSKQLALETPPEDGVALHVKMDTANDAFQSIGGTLYEFHLTNGEKGPDPLGSASKIHLSDKGGLGKSDLVFSLTVPEDAKPNGCLIFTTRKLPGSFDPTADTYASGRIYVAKYGTTIQTDEKCSASNTLTQCIDEKGGLETSYCNVVTCGNTGQNDCRANNCFKFGSCDNTGKCTKACFEGQTCLDYRNYFLTQSAEAKTCSLLENPSAPSLSGTSYRNLDLEKRCDVGKKGTTVLNKSLSDITKLDGECKTQADGTQSSQCNLLKFQGNKPFIKYGIFCDADSKWHVCSSKLVGKDSVHGYSCREEGGNFFWGGTFNAPTVQPPPNLISLRVNGGNQIQTFPDEFTTVVGSEEKFDLIIHTTGYTIQAMKLNLDKYPVLYSKLDDYPVCKPGTVKDGTECLVCNSLGTSYVEDKSRCDKLFPSENRVCTNTPYQGSGLCKINSCPIGNGWNGAECPAGSTEWSPSGGGTYRYEVCGNGAGTCSLSVCAHPQLPSTPSGLLCWYNGYDDPAAGSNVYQTCYKDATACSTVNPQVPCSFASTYSGTQSDGRTILYQDGTSQDLTGLCDKDRKDCTLTVSVKCSISKFSNSKLLAFQGEVTTKESGPLGSNTVSVKVIPPPG